MRKILLTITISFIATLAISQNYPAGPSGENAPLPGRNNEFICAENTVFSQVYPTFSGAFYCQSGYMYNRAVDNYIAAAPFSRLRFWGADFYGCNLVVTEMFDIYIWDNNPKTGGNLLHTFSLPGTTTPLGVSWIGTEFYQVDIELGTSISQLNGWIGITRTGNSCSNGNDYGFAWAASGVGNSVSYNGNWITTGSNLMFCLGGDPQSPELPLSNWALYLGAGLIIIFAFIRIRRAI